MNRRPETFRQIISETIVQNPVASVQTGTAIARIVGLHGQLFFVVALAYFPDSKHQPASFGGNSFSLYQYVRNADGTTTQLSNTPVNGSGGQAAPDAWEGATQLPELELRHSYVGMGVADVGHWEVVVSVTPAVEMCQSLFDKLAGEVAIRLQGPAVTLS